MTEDLIHRRAVLGRAASLLGGALSMSAVAGVLAGCAASPSPVADASPAGDPATARSAAIAVIADLILPRTDTPGAIDVGVPAFIERMMADYYRPEERRAFMAGLDRVDTDARATLGRPFLALSSGEQTALLERYDREAYDWARAGGEGATPFFRTMKELTTLGYFTSETGASKVLKYDPIPGAYEACIPYADVGRAWST